MKQIILAVLFAAFAPAHAEEIGKILMKSKTAGQFLTNISPVVGPENVQFFEGKLKGLENSPFNLVQTGTNEFTFNPKETPLKFKVESQPQTMKITLNGHTINADRKTTREEFFNMLVKAMPNTQQSSHWPSILPEAHAGKFKYVATAVTGVAVWGVGVAMRAAGYCPKLDKTLNECEKNIYTFGKERLQNGADLVMGTENIFTFCMESKKLKECLERKQKEKNVMVDAKYHEFFGLTGTPSATPEKSAEGKN